jgi:hypothetical protein
MLLKTLNAGLISLIAILSLMGCNSDHLQKEFFRQPPETRLARFRQCSLEDQYKIFRYGNDMVEPPVFGLANPIAELGAQVVPFLLGHLKSEGDDASVRDIMLIFSVMAVSKAYDVKADAALMKTLDAAVAGMRDKGWQDTCAAMLKRIKDSKVSVSFKYDPFGRRIYKSSSSATSVSAYDGEDVVEETVATGTVVARYSQGPKVDEPLATLRSGATSYYQADGLGSILSLSNGSGALAQTYTFDSFGKQTATTGSQPTHSSTLDDKLALLCLKPPTARAARSTSS